ncbi:MAG TPA: FAD:protein FMN transferase [Solirubrobacteraceae bacterium]|jgi:thiamine biosynthesis lipoprotein|nr:FAD:protein FMN transferase [Solirubrobacteraceae bacterium]
MTRESTRRFGCFGATVTVHVGGRSDAGTEAPLAALLAQGRLLGLHRRLSRFDPASELSLLNADAAEVVHASRLLRRLAHAVVQAGERSGGLVDATLVGALERAGYGASRVGVSGLDPAELAHAAASPARPARPHPARAWEQIVVDDEAGTIARPPGLRIDSGGLCKGLAADLLADRLAGHPLFAVDCAGDVRIGGSADVARRVLVDDPAGGGKPLHELSIVDGAVATSGIARRSWRDGRGAAAHHLLDPATGRPAWTGVVQATALAPTALEAETLAKAALLAGPARGRELLLHGGVLVLDGGDVDVVERAPTLRAA